MANLKGLFFESLMLNGHYMVTSRSVSEQIKRPAFQRKVMDKKPSKYLAVRTFLRYYCKEIMIFDCGLNFKNIEKK